MCFCFILFFVYDLLRWHVSWIIDKGILSKNTHSAYNVVTQYFFKLTFYYWVIKNLVLKVLIFPNW